MASKPASNKNRVASKCTIAMPCQENLKRTDGDGGERHLAVAFKRNLPLFLQRKLACKQKERKTAA